jgi:hypothetical protein
MFVMNLGCSPHFKQRGEVGFWRSCFSMPHKMPRTPCGQVKRKDVTGLSKIDHAPITEDDHTRMMVWRSKTLTRDEFVSLLVVGSPTSITDPPPRIPVEHSARLIALEFITDLSGRLRTTTSGRSRIAAGFENTPVRDVN